jgi:hypothetical protein
VARLPAASRAARAATWHLGRYPPPMLSAVAQASLESDLAGKVHVLASDPKDGLAAALARLGRAFRSSATTCWQRTCGNFAMTW